MPKVSKKPTVVQPRAGVHSSARRTGAHSPSIREAWGHRLNQRIEECRRGVAELRAGLGLPPGPIAPEAALPPGADAASVLEMILLTASLQRADGRLAACWASLEAADRLAAFHGIQVFQLPFQRALTTTLKSDWFSALELFLSAVELATDDIERAYALFNVIHCQESIGLDFKSALEKTRALVRRHARRPELDGVRSQLEALELRLALRHGDFARVLRRVVARRSAEGIVGQSVHFRLWAGALPYHVGRYAAHPRDERDFFGSSPHFLHKGYRVRTLQGVLHPDDAQAPRAMEFADRLYLWAWKWLVDPAAFPIDRINETLKAADWRQLAIELSADDRQQVENALAWLSLFDPSIAARVDRALRLIRLPKSAPSALLRFERAVVAWAVAARDGRELEARGLARSLREDPLARRRDIGLAALVSDSGARVPPALRGLRARLDALVRRDEQDRASALVIDLGSSRIEAAGRAAVVSSPMARAFDLLRRQGSVGCAEMLAFAFGIGRYDPTIHSAKIFNLLARMRAVCPPELRLSVKSERVHAVGSWQSVRIRSEGEVLIPVPLAQPPAASAARARLPSRDLESERWFARLRDRGTIRRGDVESVTGMSRAAANRLLARWLGEGRLRREGHARNTRYIPIPAPEGTHDS